MCRCVFEDISAAMTPLKEERRRKKKKEKRTAHLKGGALKQAQAEVKNLNSVCRAQRIKTTRRFLLKWSRNAHDKRKHPGGNYARNSPGNGNLFFDGGYTPLCLISARSPDKLSLKPLARYTFLATEPPSSRINNNKKKKVTMQFAKLLYERACCAVLSKKAPLPCINRVDTTDLSAAKVDSLRAHGRAVATIYNVTLQLTACGKIHCG